MKKIILNSAIFSFIALLAAPKSQAISIDEATFKYYGGNLSDLANIIQKSNNTLRSFSRNKPWLSVGEIERKRSELDYFGCTATWLGDKNNWSYFLTAAHCVTDSKPETFSGGRATDPTHGFSYYGTFYAWNKTTIATGSGFAYVAPQSGGQPTEMLRSTDKVSQHKADIAIVKLPHEQSITDSSGKPVEQPILNDSSNEKGLDVIYVGYGTWGVGDYNSENLYPTDGNMRLYGRSRVDDIHDLDYQVGAVYKPVGPSESWARTTLGDSGSAWWQFHNGHPVITATTIGHVPGNGQKLLQTRGMRVSKYANWIKSIYPEARFLSDVKPQGCIVKVDNGEKHCLAIGEKTNALPPDFYGKDIYVEAGTRTTVKLSDFDNLSYGRIADFHGTTLNNELKAVKTAHGETIDFSKPHSMSVHADDVKPVSCITSLTSAARYCRTSDQPKTDSLPPWIYDHEIQVEAASGHLVRLSDFDNLSYNRIADFSGLVQNWELKKVHAHNGQYLDFSRPHSMLVLQQPKEPKH